MIKNKTKKGISELISYVLLIVLAMAMATATYIFLKPYAEKPLPEEACPEGVSIIIQKCDYDESANEITLTLKNNGLFNITGVLVNIIANNLTYNATTIPENLLGIRSDFFAIGKKTETSFSIPGQIEIAHLNKEDSVEIIPLRRVRGLAQICTNAITRLKIEFCI